MGPEHNTHFDNLFKVCMNMLVGIIPQSTDIGKAYESATSAEDQDFVQNLALFLTAFFKVGPLRPVTAARQSGSLLSDQIAKFRQSKLRDILQCEFTSPCAASCLWLVLSPGAKSLFSM